MDSARIRVSLDASKNIKTQKSVSSDIDSSTGPQKTGIIKKHGAIHKTRSIVAVFMRYYINKDGRRLSRKVTN